MDFIKNNRVITVINLVDLKEAGFFNISNTSSSGDSIQIVEKNNYVSPWIVCDLGYSLPWFDPDQTFEMNDCLMSIRMTISYKNNLIYMWAYLYADSLLNFLRQDPVNLDDLSDVWETNFGGVDFNSFPAGIMENITSSGNNWNDFDLDLDDQNFVHDWFINYCTAYLFYDFFQNISGSTSEWNLFSFIPQGKAWEIFYLCHTLNLHPFLGIIKAEDVNGDHVLLSIESWVNNDEDTGFGEIYFNALENDIAQGNVNINVDREPQDVLLTDGYNFLSLPSTCYTYDSQYNEIQITNLNGVDLSEQFDSGVWLAVEIVSEQTE